MIEHDSISREEIFICMKKWERAEITCLDIAETSHEWRVQLSFDGGYLGDGKFTGWFGKPESTPANIPTPTPAPAPIPEAPSNGAAEAVDEAINRLS